MTTKHYIQDVPSSRFVTKILFRTDIGTKKVSRTRPGLFNYIVIKLYCTMRQFVVPHFPYTVTLNLFTKPYISYTYS